MIADRYSVTLQEKYMQLYISQVKSQVIKHTMIALTVTYYISEVGEQEQKENNHGQILSWGCSDKK